MLTATMNDPRTASPGRDPAGRARLRPPVAPQPHPTAARAAQLQELLTELRTHADPLLVPTNNARRRSPGLTQAQVAAHLGITTTYYRRLEQGAAPWKVEPGGVAPWLESLAHLFSLTEHQRRMLYRLALGWEPEPEPERAAPEAREVTRTLIDSLPYPALLTDPLYAVVHTNRHATAMFPPLQVGTNAAKAALCDPGMRRRLHDWRASWATPIISGLRLAALRLPEQHHARIDALIAELLRDEEVRALWKQTRGTAAPSVPRQRVVLTEDGPVTVRLSLHSPADYPHGKLLLAVPVDQPRRNPLAPSA